MYARGAIFVFIRLECLWMICRGQLLIPLFLLLTAHKLQVSEIKYLAQCVLLFHVLIRAALLVVVIASVWSFWKGVLFVCFAPVLLCTQLVYHLNTVCLCCRHIVVIMLTWETICVDSGRWELFVIRLKAALMHRHGSLLFHHLSNLVLLHNNVVGTDRLLISRTPVKTPSWLHHERHWCLSAWCLLIGPRLLVHRLEIRLITHRGSVMVLHKLLLVMLAPCFFFFFFLLLHK